MLLSEINPGPFAPLVGYVGAIIGTTFLLRQIWQGRNAIWQSPDQDLPSTAPKIVGVLCGVGIVFLWLYTNPETINSLINLSIVLGIILVVSYLLYSFLIGALSYYKEEIINSNSNSTDKKKIIGGLWLREEARKNKKKYKVSTIQELFMGSAYDPDKLWSRFSRGLAKTVLISLYLITMISGTLAISEAGFIIQVKLTDKPAAEIIYKTQAPGLEEKNPEL